MDNEKDVELLQAQKNNFDALLISQQNKMLSVFPKQLESQFWCEREKRFIALVTRVFYPGTIIYMIFQVINITSNYIRTDPLYRMHDVLLNIASSTAGWIGFLSVYCIAKHPVWNKYFYILVPIVLGCTFTIVQSTLLSSESVSMTWRGTLIIIFSLMLGYICTGSRPKFTLLAGVISIIVTMITLFFLGKHISFWIITNVLILGNLMGLALSVMSISTERSHFLQSMIIGIDKQIYEILNGHFLKLSQQDTLTLLGNRRTFNEQLSRIYNQAIEENHCFALIFIDVDYFKLYNDTYGHQQGDFALIRVAKTLMRHISESDSAIRYGGEEFIVLLNHADHDTATQVAEAIMQDIREQRISHETSKIKDYLTVSIGLSLFSGEKGITESGLLKLADDALYQAKENGRDQMIVYTSDQK